MVFVGEIMDKNPVIVDPEDVLLDVLEKLKERDVCFVYKGVYYGGLTRFHILKKRLNLRETKAKTVAVPTTKLIPEHTLEEAAKWMIENDFYYLPVFDGIDLIGEVSYLKIFEYGKEKLKEYSVRDIMTRDPIVIHDNEPVGRAIGLMKRNKISNLPVVDENRKLVGIVTARDIIEKVIYPKDRQRLGDWAGEKIVPLSTPVRDIMSKVFPEVFPEDPLPLAVDRMINLKCSVAIVTKGGYPIGIITRKDILELLAEEKREGEYMLTISSNFPILEEDIRYFTDKIWQRFGDFLRWAHFIVYIKREGKPSGFRYVVRIKLRSHVKTWISKAEDYSYFMALKEAFEILEEQIIEDKEEFLERPGVIEF